MPMILSGARVAKSAVVLLGDLDTGLVLAPERYDPRRQVQDLDGVPLTDMCTLVRDTVNSTGLSSTNIDRYCVLDTSAAREGFLVIERPPMARSEIGSLKKRARSGDVLISRLRPYLRQVAYVDREALDWAHVAIACSSEFYVLRPLDETSIAFLVPFLLSPAVQTLLAASQEGGHHPRVREATLRSLRVPRHVLADRTDLSAAVEQAADHFRSATKTIAHLVGQVGAEVERG
jgi:hypothetical protein